MTDRKLSTVKTEMTREDIVDLLEWLGTPKIKDSGKDNIQFCCTVHGEHTPSAGISVSKQTYNCFSCHSKGSLSWLLVQSRPDEFTSIVQADNFLLERYGVDNQAFDLGKIRDIRRYNELLGDHKDKGGEEVRKVFPLATLAPYKCGKETYEYFYDRGFTRKTVKDFMIGRDTFNETVTIPVFWEDGEVAGKIGRYIDPNRPKNSRYLIYEVETAKLMFPADKFVAIDNTAIIVEGILDAVWLHQCGFRNAIAMLTNSLSKEQAKWLRRKVGKVIDMTDNDKMGVIATESIKTMLKGLTYYSVKHAYPKGCKDPQDCSREQIVDMIKSAKGISRKIARYE